MAKTCIANKFKLGCYRLNYSSDCINKWNLFQLYINRQNQFMLQRSSTSGALSCLPQQGLAFVGRRNYSPALAPLLFSTSFLGMWVGPLQIFLLALHKICGQTSSGLHLALVQYELVLQPTRDLAAVVVHCFENDHLD